MTTWLLNSGVCNGIVNAQSPFSYISHREKIKDKTKRYFHYITFLILALSFAAGDGNCLSVRD